MLSHATPQEIEVWFLSAPSTTQFEREAFAIPASKERWVQSCEPIGDYCFDPVIGLYSKTGKVEDREEKFAIDEGLPQLPTATSVDRKMVNCDAKYAFDLFCGKASPEKREVSASDLEIWIDTSSSLRAIDPVSKDGRCQRLEFVEKLQTNCAKKTPLIKVYDTQLRSLGDLQGLCNSQGMNNTKKLIDWLEASVAKKVVVITDVYEYQTEFAQYLESKKAMLRGDRGIYPATELVKKVDALAKACQD